MESITPLNILCIGKNKPLADVMDRLINEHKGWKGFVTTNMNEAAELLQLHSFHIVLLTNGISPDEEKAFRQKALELQPDTVIIQHFGGGSGLLENEIISVLDQVKNK